MYVKNGKLRLNTLPMDAFLSSKANLWRCGSSTAPGCIQNVQASDGQRCRHFQCFAYCSENKAPSKPTVLHRMVFLNVVPKSLKTPEKVVPSFAVQQDTWSCKDSTGWSPPWSFQSPEFLLEWSPWIKIWPLSLEWYMFGFQGSGVNYWVLSIEWPTPLSDISTWTLDP